MARKKKPSGRLRRGPFTTADFKAAVRLDGWTEEKGGRGDHTNWCHAKRPGKITIDEAWTSVKPGHDPFRGIMAQGGYSKQELLKLLNGIPLS
jgi:hypothetical protein